MNTSPGRADIIFALGKFDDPRVADTLLALLKEDEFFLVQAPIFTVLSARHDTRIIPLLLAQVKAPTLQANHAAEWLGAVGEPAREPLMELLNDPESRVRSQAARALGLIGDKRAAPALITELPKENYAALGALAAIGDPAAIAPLITALATANDAFRLQIEQALGSMKARQAVDPLIALLAKQPSPSECATLIEALGEIGDQRAAEAILPFLQDIDGRLSAAVALGKLRAPAAVEPLQALLKTEEDPTVRAAAGEAVKLIEGKAAGGK